MVDFKKFYTTACDLYFQKKYHHETDDWEQEYFDAMEVCFNDDTQECLIHLFYADDENVGSAVQGVLDDLVGKKLITATCFDDEGLDCTVAVMLVKKD